MNKCHLIFELYIHNFERAINLNEQSCVTEPLPLSIY